MKVGDTLICKKDRDDYQTKGQIYEILNINTTDNEISMSVNQNKYHISCHFRLNKTSEKDHSNFYLLSDYFNTIKINRRDKLKKIYENN